MSRTTFTVKVYDKGINTDKAWTISWVTVVPVIALVLVSIIFFTDEELRSSVLFTIVFWCSVILLGLIRILRIVDIHQDMSPLGVLMTLNVNEKSIEYLSHSIPLSSVVSIILVIEEKEKNHSRGNNNLFRIRTAEREFNLGLVIDSKDDLVNADKMADFLKSKNVPVDYERWFTLNI